MTGGQVSALWQPQREGAGPCQVQSRVSLFLGKAKLCLGLAALNAFLAGQLLAVFLAVVFAHTLCSSRFPSLRRAL